MSDLKLRQSSLYRIAVNLFACFGFLRFIQLGQILSDALFQLLLLVLEPL